jgi:hypothetical protein
VTADTALRLEDRFRMPTQFWMHLQADWVLQMALQARRVRAGSGQRKPVRAAAQAQGRKDRAAAKPAGTRPHGSREQACKSHASDPSMRAHVGVVW